MKRPKGASVHILTGPIYIDGAEPGDALEIRVRDIQFRVPYGVNNTGPGKGVLPKLLSTPRRTDPPRSERGWHRLPTISRFRSGLHGHHGGRSAA